MRSIQLYQLVKNRRKHQVHRQQSPTSRFLQVFACIAGLICCGVIAGLSFAAIAYVGLTADLPALERIQVMLDPREGVFFQPTRIYDRTGENLLLSMENPGVPRRYLPVDPNAPESISPRLVQVIVSLVEPDFWNSPGVNWAYLTFPRPLTIAEKLVDELLLDQQPVNLGRSLRMRLLAAQLISHYGHSQVLEWYLNSAYFGHQAYGIDCAARLYLGKPASQVELAEAALLAAVLEVPSLNPLDAHTAAMERQLEALGKLLGRAYISLEEYQKARSFTLKLQPEPKIPTQPAQAFTRLVVEQLANQIGRQRLERGGFQIITSLDLELQLEAECTLRTQVARLTGKPANISRWDGKACTSALLLPTLPPSNNPMPVELTSSALVMEPTTGQVLALVGESLASSETSRFAAHEPGSLLSPLVMVAAFGRGFSPASLVWDIPVTLPNEAASFQNPDGKYHGPQRLRLAVANDYLIPINKLLNQLGPITVWRLLEPFGLTGLLNVEKPDALLFSGGNLTLLEIGQAYSIFANSGSQAGKFIPNSTNMQSVMVLNAKDAQGKIWVDNNQSQTQAVLSPQLAALVQDILSDETARWPSLGHPNPLEIGRPVGAKIGQIAGAHAMWAVGYTPQRMVVVWMGFDPEQKSQPHLEVRQPAGIWHALMQHASQNLPVAGWTQPSGINSLEVCDPSGQLPSNDCPLKVNEIFLNGNEPTTIDSLYRVFQVNRETNRLATVFTPLEVVENRTYLVVPPEAQDWARSARLLLPPSAYDSIQIPATSDQVRITNPSFFGYVHGQVAIRGSAAGENFASYRLQVGEGLNPRSWLQVGQEGTTTVEEGELGKWNTQGLDGLYAIRLIVVRKDQRFETAIIQVTVDNSPPQVRLPYPEPGQRFRQAETPQVTLIADVQDRIGVARVEWYLDGVRIGERTQVPFSLSWKVVKGNHTLLIKALDLAGNQAESQSVSFVVE